jgi:putative SOS response-associated peptidase YedK
MVTRNTSGLRTTRRLRSSLSIAAGGKTPTGQPNELVAEIHTWMPVILPPETHERWLSGESGKEILRPFPAKELTARMISKRINQPENNDPSVLEEGEMEQAGRLI